MRLWCEKELQAGSVASTGATGASMRVLILPHVTLHLTMFSICVVKRVPSCVRVKSFVCTQTNITCVGIAVPLSPLCSLHHQVVPAIPMSQGWAWWTMRGMIERGPPDFLVVGAGV
jgi:hypothetical protein